MADSVDFITLYVGSLIIPTHPLGLIPLKLGVSTPPLLNGILNHQKRLIFLPMHTLGMLLFFRFWSASYAHQEEDCRSQKSCQVINNKGPINVSTSCDVDPNPKLSLPGAEDRFLGSKFEETKRKLREQFEKVENEKKNQCIQIVEFHKPVPSVQTKAKKAPVKKQKKRNALQLIRASTTTRLPRGLVMFPRFDSFNQKTDRYM